MERRVFKKYGPDSGGWTANCLISKSGVSVDYAPLLNTTGEQIRDVNQLTKVTSGVFPVRGRIDTGASHVVVPLAISQYLKLECHNAGDCITANGNVDAWSTFVDLAIPDWQNEDGENYLKIFKHIEAVTYEMDMPYILIGNSLLFETKLTVENKILTLESRE